MLKKNVFVLSLFGYVVLFNLLVLNSVIQNGAIVNSMTGNVVSLGANPTSDPKFVLPLFMFNLAIVGLFTFSYHNYNNLYRKKTRHNRA